MSLVKKHKNDILLIAAVLALALGVWIFTSLTREAGAEVVVSISGEEVMRLPLGEDTELVIGGGEHTNTLVISGGEAWVSEASCPDHVCINQGKVSLNGQTIVCLPNKLVVSIAGGESGDIDGIAG